MPHDVLTGPIAAAREDRVRRLFRELRLSETHINVLKLYNAHQPYHNAQHAFIVVLNAYTGGLHENLHEHELRLLALAALYHDFAHSGNPTISDTVNVAKAINASREWLSMKEPWLTAEDKNQIANLIFATEARHRVTAATRLESILMDADILATDVEDRDLWIKALADETGREMTLESSLTFIRCMEFHSGWGMKRQRVYIDKLTLVQEQLSKQASRENR